MSRWTDNFQGQQPFQRVQAILDSLLKLNLESIIPPLRAEYDRAIKVLKLLEGRFSILDPEMFPPNALINLNQWLTQAAVQAEAAQNNPAHLHNVNAHLDDILGGFRPIDIGFSENDLKGLIEASAIYRGKLIQELDLVKKHTAEIKKQYDSLEVEISHAELRLKSNDEVISSQKTRLDTSISEFQKQFSTAQETRNQDFLKAIATITQNALDKFKEIDVTYKGILAAQEQAWDALIGDLKKKSDEHLEFITKRKKEVDDIFGAIGAAAIAGNFNDIADKERGFANYWRNIAFFFFCGIGVVALMAFALTFINNPDWETFLFRIGTALILSVPAFYAANESSKHREREKIIRKNFLELSAIDAYLVNLPEKERNEIRGKLSEKFFGVPEIHEKIEGVSNKDLLGFIEKLVRDLTKGH